ncbi:MAG: hypothetical protein GTN93_23530 [Anaerolineae bacterium]|nr:hypothetical protein [Anaerolineae bacterium]
MAYEFRYQLCRAPQPTMDGSGVVIHDVCAVYRVDPADPWVEVPGRHQNILVPSDVLSVALTQPTTAEKVQAYKQALADYLGEAATAITGWGIAQLTTLLDLNFAAASAASMAHDFITNTLGLSYPDVRFIM